MLHMRPSAVAGLAAALIVSACTAPAPAAPGAAQKPAAAASTATPAKTSKLYSPATAESGADIPEATVKFGMRPYADNTYFVIGMEKGWFKDVGITIDPQPTGLKTTEDQWVALLLNRQVDINSATCSIL